jgi:hypothetical protein
MQPQEIGLRNQYQHFANTMTKARYALEEISEFLVG